MKLIMLVALLLSTSVMAGPLQGPHEHGKLGVAIINEGDFLIFKMVLPSKDLLGFESSPKTKRMKEMVTKQYEKLYKEEALPKLFKFMPVDACKPFSADMYSDMLDYHEHDDVKDKVSIDVKDVHSVGDKNGHSDFFLNYTFECDKVDLIQITFHEVFPSIKRVNFYGGGEVKGKFVASSKAKEAIVAGAQKE